MTRRSRARFVLALAVLGVPAVVMAAALWYLGTGQLEARLADEWAARFPGRLHIGSVRLADADHAQVHSLRLDIADGAKPLLSTTVIDVRGALHRGAITAVRATNATLAIDRAAVAWGREFAAALLRLPASTAARQPLAIDLSELRIEIVGGLLVTGLRVTGSVNGPAVNLVLSGQLAGEPFELALTTVDGPRYRLHLKRLAVDLPHLLLVLDALGVPQLGAQVRSDLAAWLPTLVHLDDLQVEFDLAARRLRTLATARPRWHGGEGAADLVLDQGGLVLTNARADDAALGKAQGRVHVAVPEGDLTVDIADWRPGPRLALPAEVPIREVLAYLPAARLHLRHPLAADGKRHLHLNLTALPAGADPQRSPTHLDVSWTHDQGLRIYGEALPLPLAQSWLPAGLVAITGRIHAFFVQLNPRLSEMRARVHGGELRWSGWTFSDLELAASVLPTAGDGFAASVHLPDEAALGWTGSGSAATLSLNLPRIQSVLPNLRGPHPLPPLTGGVELRADLVIAADAITGQVKHIACTDLANDGIFSGLTSSARGSFSQKDGTTALKIDGQLVRGRVRLSAGWLDLAARTPIYAAGIDYRPERIVVKELIARAADSHGRAVTGGYTIGVKGELDRGLAGRLHGVVDHADLAWIKANSIVVELPASATVVGEGAATFTATLAARAVQQIEGFFLPLNTDISLFNGSLEIGGITGAVRFVIARSDAPAVVPQTPAPPVPPAAPKGP